MKRLIILIVILFILISGCGRGTLSEESFNEAFKENWGLEMPENVTWTYNKEGKVSFNGDGIRYNVFTYETEDDIDGWLTFSSEQGKTLFSDNYEQAIENFLIEMNRNIKEEIVFEDSLYYYQLEVDNSELFIVLNEENKKIYIVESFM